MSLKYHRVFITPEDEVHLSAAIDPIKHPQAYKWLAYVRSELYSTWRELNNGCHLKEAYRDDVYAWNDEDLN